MNNRHFTARMNELQLQVQGELVEFN